MGFRDDPVFARLWAHAPHALRAVMAAPAPVRGRLALLFALDIELYFANQASKEDMINAIKLAWWHEAINALPQGAERHELLGAMVVEGVDVAMAARMAAAYQAGGDGLRVLIANAATLLDAEAQPLNDLVDRVAAGMGDAAPWPKSARPVVIFLRKLGLWAALKMRLLGR